MLRPPSVILERAGASSRRQYASIVFRCLQQTAKDTNKIFTSCFVNESDADLYRNHVQERIDATLSCPDKDMAEECIVLPPLFWTSSEDCVCDDVTDGNDALRPPQKAQLLLVMYGTGPIFPVVRVQKAEHVIGDMQLLDKLYHAYEALSSERATRSNIASVIANTSPS